MQTQRQPMKSSIIRRPGKQNQDMVDTRAETQALRNHSLNSTHKGVVTFCEEKKRQQCILRQTSQGANTIQVDTNKEHTDNSEGVQTRQEENRSTKQCNSKSNVV